MIHGCKDGFSRTVVFLQCNTDNRAATVLQLFERAVAEYGLPLRIRCDYGSENFEVARAMLERRGTGQGSVITGRSVHNQRIERLWRDVYITCLQSFRALFIQMEDFGLFNRDNEIHILALQTVFLPRINRTLQLFVSQWNNHILRTEGLTPLQLYTQGFLSRNAFPQNFTAYGIDDDGPIPQLQTNNNVNVPECLVDLDDEAIQFEDLDVLEDDVHIYRECCEFIQRHAQN